MKSKRAALVAFLMLAGALAPSLTHAQETTGSTITVQPKTVKPAKIKIDTFKGEVVRMNTVSIVVRDPKNSYVVRTFTFSPDLTKKLQGLIGRGGYQPGDSVTIRFAHGGSEAREIKGKPSKPY
jgi:hypothetical protein